MYYFFLFLFLLVTEFVYFCIAGQLNITDQPNSRSSHTRITLRGGGVIFPVAVLIYFLSNSFCYPWFLGGLLLIAAISFTDDLRGISPKARLICHLTAILLLLFQWDVSTLYWYYIPLILIVCAGIINAYNFMDGINGITGGYSLIIIGALWYINLYIVHYTDPVLLYTAGISLLVFNLFNFRKKAKCFAGDVGSVSIAFIILFTLGKLIIETHDPSYIILLAVYGTDSILTIVHRIILHENLFKAHRKHAYQLLANELRLPHILIATTYMLLQLLIFAGYIWLQEWKYVYCAGVIVILSLVYYGLIRKYYKLHAFKPSIN